MNGQSLIGILGIVVGIMGVGGPIAWDYFKTKTEIEVRVAQLTPIVERKNRVDGLVVTYGGQEVEELSRVLITVRNIGRTSVLKKDIVDPITLSFGAGARILDAKIEQVHPLNLQATLQFDRQKREVIVEFPLLNPGDSVHVLLVGQVDPGKVSPRARIAGVESVTYVEYEPPTLPEPQMSKPALYTVAGFSLLMLFGGAGGIVESRKERRIRKLAQGEGQLFPALPTRTETKGYLEELLSFTAENERRPVTDLLDSLPETENFANAHRERIEAEVRRLLKYHTPDLPMAIAALLTSGVGLAYIGFMLWR